MSPAEISRTYSFSSMVQAHSSAGKMLRKTSFHFQYVPENKMGILKGMYDDFSEKNVRLTKTIFNSEKTVFLVSKWKREFYFAVVSYASQRSRDFPRA